MRREKQIEEMAKSICHAPYCERRKNGCTCDMYCKASIYAERAIDAGYRKATDVAAEIFAEIETSLVIGGFVNGEKYIAIREDDYNHYKKKYTGEGK